MYNFFVTAEIGAWDRKFYEYDRSRFLEYTEDRISAQFEPLSQGRISALLALPCLFAYEGDEHNVRIGTLTSIKERERRILIEFEFDPDLPEIPYQSIQPIAPLLDIRDWEMNRTHWAVKDEDLFKRLSDEGLIPANVARHHSAPKPTTSKAGGRKGSPRVRTVTGFISKVFEDQDDKANAIFYRGHSHRHKYKLEPSLFRTDEQGNYLYRDSEHVLYRELIVSNSADFSADEYTLDKLVRMQHYSLPTRLLDITSNPLIALYFACMLTPE